MNFAGALATAGNLVFLSHVDGTFSAYDARTLKELRSFNARTGINAPAISYAENGKQYVAALAGTPRITLRFGVLKRFLTFPAVDWADGA